MGLLQQMQDVSTAKPLHDTENQVRSSLRVLNDHTNTLIKEMLIENKAQKEAKYAAVLAKEAVEGAVLTAEQKELISGDGKEEEEPTPAADDDEDKKRLREAREARAANVLQD